MSTIKINIPAKLLGTDFESLKNVWQQGFDAGVATKVHNPSNEETCAGSSPSTGSTKCAECGAELQNQRYYLSSSLYEGGWICEKCFVKIYPSRPIYEQPVPSSGPTEAGCKFGEGVIDALTREKNRKLNEFLDSVKDQARDIPERPGFPCNSELDKCDALSFMPGKIQRIPMSYDYLAGWRDGVREMIEMGDDLLMDKVILIVDPDKLPED